MSTTVDEDVVPDSAPRPAVRRRRSTRGVRLAVAGCSVGAALLAQLSSASPTGEVVVDRIWCALAAAGVTYLASRSTRTSWLWMTGIAAAAGIGSPAMALTLPALALAAASVLGAARLRVVGAIVGALSVAGLLLLPDLGVHGAASLVAVVAVVPVVVEGYRTSPRRVRRAIRRGAGWSLAGLVVVSGAAAVAVGLSGPALVRGVDEARAGLGQAGDGDQTGAAGRFTRSEDEFASADGLLGGPLAWGARLVPVLAQHVDALSTASSSGRRLAESGQVAAASAPYQDLKADGGRLDLAQVAAMQEPVAEAAATLEQVAEDLDHVRSPWLLPPATSAVDRFGDEVDDALPSARLADQALRVAPGLLGAEGDRSYLVLFTNPAETRNLGGFTGSYALLQARDGDLDVDVTGEIATLNAAPGPRAIDGQEEFLERYDRYRPERFLQNLTVSPDMETTAEVSRQMFAQATGTEVDGVIVADPYALAALLQLTGPIDVPSVGFALDSENVADFLLRDQYLLFEGEQEARKDRLEDVGRATFDALTERPLPGPRQLGDLLGPAVDEKRLLFYPFDPDEQDLMTTVGVLGELSAPEGSDLLSVRMANLRASKMDTFIDRSITYDVTYDPRSGVVEGRVDVTIRNTAPTGGLPEYVIGSLDSPDPQGTARVMVSVFTPLTARGATLDGAVTGLEPQVERGLNVFSTPVVVPSGGEVTLTVELSGTVEGMGEVYRLVASSQPLANPDELSVVVRSADGAPAVERATGLDVDDGEARRSGPWATDQRARVTFDG